eukprot:1074765-Amphidinium_carterae.1
MRLARQKWSEVAQAPTQHSQAIAKNSNWTIHCYAKVDSEATSSTASKVRHRGVWGWIAVPTEKMHDLRDLPQGLGPLCREDLCLRQLSQFGGELHMLAEAMAYAMTLQGDSVKFVLMSSGDVLGRLFSKKNNRSEEEIAVRRVNYLCEKLMEDKRLSFDICDSVYDQPAIYLKNRATDYLSQMEFQVSSTLHSSSQKEQDWLMGYLEMRYGVQIQGQSSVSSEPSHESTTRFLVKAAASRYVLPDTNHENTFLETTASDTTPISQWGNCFAVATFNVNRLPWHKLGSWLELLEGEVKWSVLALQEIFDDTGVEDGWYDISGNQCLVTRTHTKQLTGLVLHSSFAPRSPPCFEIGAGSVATTIQIGGMAIRVCACYLPCSGVDRQDPEKFAGCLRDLEKQLLPFSNRLLLGDLNGWLGRSLGDSLTLGAYNLPKTNNRGTELLAWIASLGLKVSSTFMPHHILETRHSFKGNDVSSIDYICATSKVHNLFVNCEVFPVPARSDHLFVRMQLKQVVKHRFRGQRQSKPWDHPEFVGAFTSALPIQPATSMQEWQQAVLQATAVATAALPRGKSNRKNGWDEKALELWSKRHDTVGVDRIALSKQLYAHLKKKKAMQKLQECADNKRGLFGVFSKPPSKKVLLVDDDNKRLPQEEAIHTLENTLGAKIAATKDRDWVHNIFIHEGWDFKNLFTNSTLPSVKEYRARIGRGSGLDHMHPMIIKHLPDNWLTCIPNCLQTSLLVGDVATASWNSQRMKPLPKLNKARLTAKSFRGIAISNVVRGLSTIVFLKALADYITSSSPLSFAYAKNRNAESLQLCLGHATKLMGKYYGQCCLAKSDISAAFDTVDWERLKTALCKRGLPENMAVALVQSQMSGYCLYWEGVESRHVFYPTRGTRQGCKLGPCLYKLYVEDVLEPLAASWQWAPRPSTNIDCIGTETFGINCNDPARHHLLLYSDDIYVLDIDWFKATTALQNIRRALQRAGMDTATHKTEVVCWNGPCTIPANSSGVTCVGGREDNLVILGGEFNLSQGFGVTWNKRVQRSLKTWYVHKQLFTEPAITLERRYKSVAPVCQSALFWSTRAAYPTTTLLHNIDTQALKFG